MLELLAVLAVVGPVAEAPASPPAGQATEVARADESGSPRTAAYYEYLLGLHHETSGELDEAVAAYRRASDLDPRSAEIPATLAGLYARLNRPQDALRTAEAALAIDADNLDAHRVLGEVHASLAQLGDQNARDHVAKAITHLERAGVPDDIGGQVRLARLYVVGGSAEKAIPLLTRIVEREPRFSEAAGLLVEAYAASGRESDAIDLLEGLAREEPQYYRTLAGLYERSQRWREAAAAYEKASAASPRSNEVKLRWATALLNLSSADALPRAQALLEEVTSARPNDARALYLLSITQRRAKNLDAAATTAERLIAADPKNLWGPYALAQVHEEREDYHKVIEVLEPTMRAVAGLDPSMRPDGARVLIHLGFAYQQVGQHQRATDVLEQADRLSPDAAVAFQIGASYERQERYADAERAFRTALERDPNHAPTLNYLGYMLAERGERLEESVEFIRRALEVEPDNPSYLDSLGWAYFKLDRLDLAEPPLRRASDELTTNSVVQDHWGDLLFRLGRYSEAIAAWELALAGDGESVERDAIEDKIRAARDKVK